MQTSLAKQLQQLKVQEKDQIKLPSKTKVSFLFEIKQAANIDDQTLYYICTNGLQEIQQEIPQLYQQLEIFKNDIFHLKSLEFYRGQETKQTLSEIDEKLDLLIKILAPYFLYTATHKILEYLIRVYEVNSYHKQTLILSFLPYYETSFFLRLIQTLQLKNDEYFYFLDDFAYKGEALSKNILVRALSRNDGIVFTIYSEFCMKLAGHHQTILDDIQNSLHWKFFGTMLIEVLRTKYSDNQTLMFNILPFIAQSIKSQIKELKTSGLLAISQICSRKTLSADYTDAFIQEIILCIKDAELDDQMIENSLVVLMIVFQYQRVNSLSEKDITDLLNQPRLKRCIQKLSEAHDISTFQKVITHTFLQSKALDMQKLKGILQNTMTLKATYKIIESILAQVSENEDLVERASQILDLLKELDLHQFNQCQVYLVKSIQSQSQKDQVLHVLQKTTKSQHLVSKFGDKEYSLLSALASQQKQTKLNALKAISDKKFLHKISQKEKDLIKLQLLQIISRSQEEMDTMELMIDSLQQLLKEEQTCDSEFEILEQFYHENARTERYPKNILDNVQELALSLNVKSESNQQVLTIWLIMQNKFDRMPQSFNCLQGSTSIEQLTNRMISDVELSFQLLLKIMDKHRSYHNEQVIVKILNQIGQQNKQETKIENELLLFYSQLISKVKRYESSKVSLILQEISTNLYKIKSESQFHEKCLQKLLSAALVLKTKLSEFPFSNFHQQLIKSNFNNEPSSISEFYIKLAIQSKNQNKKLFALLSLQNIAKHILLSPQVMICVVLILLYSDYQLVRQHTIKLAQILVDTQSDNQKDEVELFTNTPKPKSAKKNTNKPQLTPLKSKPANQLLKDILKMDREIINDKFQLETAINQSNHVSVLETAVRSLLDLPSTYIKQKFIESLSLRTNHTMIFSMTLTEQLNKEYYTIKKKETISEQDCYYLATISKLISNICTNTKDAQEENISSLVFPYLQIVLHVLKNQSPIYVNLDESIAKLFIDNILKTDVINKLKSSNIDEMLRYYIQSQLCLFSKKFRDQIKDQLISSSNEILSSQHFITLINYQIDLIKNDNDNIPEELSIILENLLNLKIKDGQELVPVLIKLVRFLGYSSEEVDNTFLIEITVQVCLQILEDGQKQKNKVDSTNIIKLLREALNEKAEELNKEIQKQISQKVEENDPFNDFLMQIDTDKKVYQEGEEKELYFSNFQIISSIFKLLNKVELSYQKTITNSESFLKSFASSMKSLIDNDQAKTSKGQHILSQLFRFYHQLVMSTCKQSTDTQEDMKETLATYIDILVLLENFNASLNEIQHFLQQILQILSKGKHSQNIELQQQFIPFILLVLLCLSLDKIELQDNLKLQSLEIKLIEKVIIQNQDSHSSLEFLNDLIFMIALIPLNEKSHEFTQNKLSILFNDDDIALKQTYANWINLRYIEQNKIARKLKYVALFIFNDWLSNSQSLQLSLAVVTKNLEGQSYIFNLFYQIYLSSYLLSEQVAQIQQSKQYEDNKVKKSLKRLNKRIQEFQLTLNKMLSYPVHVSIVLQVLEFQDKQTTTLKASTLQLLINKVPNFSQLPKPKEKELVQEFKPLIEKSIEILEEYLPNLQLVTKKHQNDKQQLIQALFAILSRTCSQLIDLDTREKSINLVFNYLKNQDKINFMLHSQFILTVMNIFEVYQTDILEHLPTYFDFIDKGYQRLYSKEESSSDVFQEQYCQTLLNASLSICTFFSKFMNATQFEILIKNVIVMPSIYEDQVKQILDVLSQVTAKNVGFKLVFQSLFNSFESVIIEKGIEQHQIKNLPQVIIRFFKDLTREVIQRMKKEFCQENYKKVYQFFKQAMNLSYQYYIQNSQVDMMKLDEVEQEIVEAFQQFAVKLNEEQLRSLTVKLIKWATKKKQQDQAFTMNMHRCIIAYKSLNGLLDTIKEFFVPFINIYFEKSLEILQSLIQIFKLTKQDKKRQRGDSQLTAIDEDGHSLYKLLTLVLNNIKLNFSYDNVTFIQNDTFEQLVDPVSNLVSLVSVPNYTKYIDDIVNPAIFEMVERINNDDMWKKLNYEVLLQARSDNWKIRLGTFKVIENLFMKIGERYLVLLNDTLPFLSEGMEDENSEVEQVARSVVTRIEQLTGDSIQEYLK